MSNGLIDLFGHNSWANRLLLAACEPLTDEQIAATVEGTYGTIGATLVHITAAQDGYLNRMTGETFGQELDEERYPGFETIRDRLWRSDEALEAAARAIDPGQVVRWTREGFNRSMPAGLLFVQTINHSTEHRSQIMTILTQIGITPLELDGWGYAMETGAFHEQAATGR